MVEKVDPNELFSYDPMSPSGIVWKCERRSGRNYLLVAASAGDVAGTVSKHGYWIVDIRGKKKRVHRLIWEMLVGPIPDGFVVDHIDGDPKNNTIKNLRVVSCAHNNRNRAISDESLSGMHGVVYKEVTNKHGQLFRYWQARGKDNNGKEVSKAFNIDKLGSEVALELAKQFRYNFIVNQEGYTERHINDTVIKSLDSNVAHG